MVQAGTPLFPLGGSGDTWFIVSGQYLYQLNSAGAIVAGPGPGGSRGSVDSTGGPYTSPAILLPNGNQLGIVCGGQFWIDEGSGPVAIAYAPYAYGSLAVGWSGTCTTFGRFIYQISGIPFSAAMVGLTITIGANNYTVETYGGIEKFGAFAGLLFLVANEGTAAATDAAFTCGNAGATLITPPIIEGGPSGFVAGDVGATLNFSVIGGPWAGSYTIVSVDSSGDAILSGSPAPNGSTGGLANEIYPPFACSSATFLDSFYIASIANSKTFQVSAPLDGTTWDPSDSAVKESYPDNIGFVLADHQELLVFGETHSEVWVAPGANPIFPFQPSESYAMSIGIAAPFSACSLRDGPAWIGASLRGQPIAYFAQGFQPQRISTHAVEQAWAKYTTFADAVAFVYEIDGHELWQISFPTGDATWVYDRTASLQMGRPQWHEENSFDGAAFHRHRGMSHCFVFGANFCGDFANGNIYQMSDTVYQDNGQAIARTRTFAHVDAQRLRLFFQKLEVDIATTAAANLTIAVSWSDDGGVTWVAPADFVYVTNGPGGINPNLDRIAFYQLGSTQTGSRVFSITIAGNAPVTWMNVYADILQGVS